MTDGTFLRDLFYPLFGDYKGSFVLFRFGGFLAQGEGGEGIRPEAWIFTLGVINLALASPGVSQFSGEGTPGDGISNERSLRWWLWVQIFEFLGY